MTLPNDAAFDAYREAIIAATAALVVERAAEDRLDAAKGTSSYKIEEERHKAAVRSTIAAETVLYRVSLDFAKASKGG